MNGDSAYSLRCTLCGTGTGPITRVVRCEHCNGVLEVSYSVFPDGRSARLPLLKPGMQISLGEGNTPEVNLRRVADALGLDKLRAKLEFMAPTGSFKDRGSALLVSLARQEGVQGFVEDSSGNAGASLSAYAAAAGMNAHIFVPATAASGKLDQIRIFGATLHAVEGPRQAATEAAQEFVRESGLPYLSHSLSPFFSEGMKPFAYEVTGHGGGIPDHIVLPVGNGSLLIGARAGFDELVASGVIARHPRFHAVQMESVCPVAAAINGEDWNPSQAAPTVASGIAVSAPPRLAQCVSAVQSSGGTAVTVTDEAALSWQRRLAAGDGIFCEATSAVAFAGLEKLVASGVISAGETVLVPVTGSGLKEQLPV